MSAQTLPAYFSYSLCLYGDYTFILELPSTQQSTSNQTVLWGTSCVLKLSLCFNGTQNKLFYTFSTFFCAVVLCSIRCNGETRSSNESLENTGIVLLMSKRQTPLKESPALIFFPSFMDPNQHSLPTFAITCHC